MRAGVSLQCACSLPAPPPLTPRARLSRDVGESVPEGGLLGWHPGSTSLAVQQPSVPVRRSGGRREPEGGSSLSSAFQDRDFLENEQFFLETLKKASYNMTSHSA